MDLEDRVRRLEADLIVERELIGLLIELVAATSGQKGMVQEGFESTVQAFIDHIDDPVIREAAEFRLERLRRSDEPSDD